MNFELPLSILKLYRIFSIDEHDEIVSIDFVKIEIFLHAIMSYDYNCYGNPFLLEYIQLPISCLNLQQDVEHTSEINTARKKNVCQGTVYKIMLGAKSIQGMIYSKLFFFLRSFFRVFFFSNIKTVIEDGATF